MIRVRRLLILGHRYLGIAISLMFVIWFASGIVMIYAGGMPRLTLQTRLEKMPALDLARVQLSPAQAAQRLGEHAAAGKATLLSVMDRPAYRFQGRNSQTVFADNGELLRDIDLEQSRRVASRFVALPEDRVHFVRTLDKADQWTLALQREMPLHKFRVDDPAATELYVSPHTAEVAVLTTRTQRGLAWIGTIPHWLYFSALRINQPLWYKVVVGLSGLGCVLAVLGLILGFTQFRRVRPFRLTAAIPYRSWMRWHYILGAIFGVFALTWVFSGLLSMEPFAWTNARGLEVKREIFSGGPPQLDSFGAMDAQTFQRLAAGRTIKELGFTRIQDEDYYAVSSTDSTQPPQSRAERLHEPYGVRGQTEPDRLLIAARTLEVRREPFSIESILNRLKAALPGISIVEQQLLSDYDSYYYSRGRQSALPVLRIKFNDPAQTWIYVNPRTSEIVANVHRFSRIERWLYNGLHSLDFSFWYHKRPLWDIGMIVLCLGGLSLSAIGLYLGVKRLIRDLRAAPSGEKSTSKPIARAQ